MDIKNWMLVITDQPTHFKKLQKQWSHDDSLLLCCTSYEKAIIYLAEKDCALVIILDINGFSNQSGIRLIRSASIIPILILTDNYNMKTKLEYIALGADEYMALNILDNLITAYSMVRRYKILNYKKSPSVLSYKALILNIDQQKLISFENGIELNKNEVRFLRLLFEFPGKVFTYQEIYQYIWEFDFNPSFKNIIWNLVSTLRKKITEKLMNENIIELVTRVGYRLKE